MPRARGLPRLDFTSLAHMRAGLAEVVGDIDPASPRGKKRLRILEAAAASFVAHGYRKTSVDDIARAAGVAKGTVYLYFATKTELLVAAIAHEKLRQFALLSGIDAPGLAPRERLRRWLRASLLMVAGSPLLTRATAGDPDILAAMIEDIPEQVEEATEGAGVFIGALLDAAVYPERWPAAERRDRIVVLESLPRFAALLRDDPLRQGLSVERFAEVLADLILDGIHPPPSAPARPRKLGPSQPTTSRPRR
jgi:AcrR family transcriptional regulator